MKTNSDLFLIFSWLRLRIFANTIGCHLIRVDARRIDHQGVFRLGAAAPDPSRCLVCRAPPFRAASRSNRRGCPALLQLGVTPPRSLLHRSIEKNLDLRLRENHRADVAPFGDHAAAPAHGALQFQHARAHDLQRRNLGRHLAHFRRANVRGDVRAVQQDLQPPLVFLQIDFSGFDERCQSGASSAKSTAFTQDLEASARYMAPVSK